MSIRVKDTFDDLIYEASMRYGVPFTWVKAIAGAESDWIPTAYRAEPQINDASYGLMQILYRTAKGLGYTGQPNGLYEPATNIDLGARYIRDLINSYGEDFQRVYSAYNSGSPTKYLTSSQVKAHVARAVSYLNAVNQVTVVVTADPDQEIPETIDVGPPAPGGAGNKVVGIGVALIAGLGLYLLTRGGH